MLSESIAAAAPAHSDLVLGIDGGGSHTVAILAQREDGGKILGRALVGPSNIQAVGEERAFQALDEAVAQAFAKAGRPRGRVGAAALGLAGVDHAESVAVVCAWCDRAQLAQHVEITNDSILLLAGGTPEGWGLAVIAGTGSIAMGRTREGRFDHSGGWGYLLGDEGSAYALAMNDNLLRRLSGEREPWWRDPDQVADDFAAWLLTSAAAALLGSALAAPRLESRPDGLSDG